MARADINEDGDDSIEIRLDSIPLLPSQTRNPKFGIYPWLQDEQSVERVPIKSDRIVNRLRDSSNPEVAKLYEEFLDMARVIVLSRPTEGLVLSELNRLIRSGTFAENIESISKINPKILRDYLHPDTYQAIQDYQTTSIRGDIK